MTAPPLLAAEPLTAEEAHGFRLGLSCLVTTVHQLAEGPTLDGRPPLIDPEAARMVRVLALGLAHRLAPAP